VNDKPCAECAPLFYDPPAHPQGHLGDADELLEAAINKVDCELPWEQVQPYVEARVRALFAAMGTSR
jgi:hypothetical protein